MQYTWTNYFLRYLIYPVCPGSPVHSVLPISRWTRLLGHKVSLVQFYIASSSIKWFKTLWPQTYYPKRFLLQHKYLLSWRLLIIHKICKRFWQPLNLDYTFKHLLKPPSREFTTDAYCMTQIRLHSLDRWLKYWNPCVCKVRIIRVRWLPLPIT